MRRAIGLTLTGLGAFLVATAALMRFYLAGELIKFPLNEYVVATLAGHDVSYFSQKQITEVSGASVRVTQTIRGDVGAGSSSTAVWQEFTSVQDVTNSQSVSTTAQRSAFNRRTGALVDCCGDYVGGDTSVRQSGQGYVWPIGTQKRTYQVFDPNTLRPEPFRYAGTAAVDGMTTYKFVEQLSNRRTGSQTLAGWLAGFPNRRVVTLSEYLTETNTVWVDPATGIPVDETQSLDRSLQDAGVTKLVLFQGTVAETSDSIGTAIDTARSSHLRMDLLQGAGPLSAALLGVVLAGMGIVLTRILPAAGHRHGRELGYQNGHLAGVGPGLPAPPEPAPRGGTRNWTSTGSWDMIGARQGADRQPGNGYWPGPRPATQARPEPGSWERPGPGERWGDGVRRVLEPGQAEPGLDRGYRGGRHRAPGR